METGRQNLHKVYVIYKSFEHFTKHKNIQNWITEQYWPSDAIHILLYALHVTPDQLWKSADPMWHFECVTNYTPSVWPGCKCHYIICFPLASNVHFSSISMEALISNCRPTDTVSNLTVHYFGWYSAKFPTITFFLEQYSRMPIMHASCVESQNCWLQTPPES